MGLLKSVPFCLYVNLNLIHSGFAASGSTQGIYGFMENSITRLGGFREKKLPNSSALCSELKAHIRGNLTSIPLH